MIFEPHGEQARWKYTYQLLRVAEVDQVLTYDELAAVTGLDPVADRHRIQSDMRRAAREHEQVDKRAIEAVPNIGYRVVEAQEHLVLAKRHQRNASRQLQRGHSKAVNVDLSGLDPEVRHAFDIVAQAFSMQMDFNRRFDIRTKRVEAEIRKIHERAAQEAQERARTDEEIAELRGRLEKLESR